MSNRIASTTTCSNCKWWSPYIPGLGECLEPITTWKEKWMRDEVDEASRPTTPDVVAEDICRKYEIKEAE